MGDEEAPKNLPQNVRGQKRTASPAAESSGKGPLPAKRKLRPEERAQGVLDVDLVLEGLMEMRSGQPLETRNARLTEEQLDLLIQEVTAIFAEQPVLLELDAPMRIAGDIHGQFYDLLRLFEYGGHPSQVNYLFLGDYVDRGRHSIESVALLFAFKVKYKENFFLLRGNHECAQINRIYGFFDECKRRYTPKLWKSFGDAFSQMPICALIDDRILCMHGGLSPELTTLDQLRNIPRPANVPESGLLCDLLWSDPSAEVRQWGDNDRGVSFTFGPEIVRSFLKKHKLDLIVRAHQVVEDGYEFFAGRQLVTVFSAPNYCNEFDNCGALMMVDEELTCAFKVLKPIMLKRVP